MKRWKKVLLLVLAILVLATAGAAIWQRKNIRAAYTALTRDPDQIASDLETVRNDFQQTIQEKTEEEIVVKPPTLQQSEDILNGTVSADEIKDALGINQVLGGSTSDAAPEVSAPLPSQTPETNITVSPQVSAKPQTTPTAPETASPQVTPSGPTAQELINQCVAELTVCQVDLMVQLGEMKRAALKVWNAMTAEERSTQLKQFGLSWLGECYKLEKVVDDQVREILSRYKTALAAIGADLSVIDTLWDYYENEKAAQKAYYLNKYLK